jgi:hypothetical protein
VPAGAVRRSQGSNRWNYDLGIDRLPAALYWRWRCSGRRGREFKASTPPGFSYAGGKYVANLSVQTASKARSSTSIDAGMSLRSGLTIRQSPIRTLEDSQCDTQAAISSLMGL